MNSQEHEAVLVKIQRTLATGKPWESKTIHYPAAHIITAVLTIKGMNKRKDDDDGGNGDGFTTNGWQWDWWQKFTYHGKGYTLSGSGYYGGHSFHLSDE